MQRNSDVTNEYLDLPTKPLFGRLVELHAACADPGDPMTPYRAGGVLIAEGYSLDQRTAFAVTKVNPLDLHREVMRVFAVQARPIFETYETQIADRPLGMPIGMSLADRGLELWEQVQLADGDVDHAVTSAAFALCLDGFPLQTDEARALMSDLADAYRVLVYRGPYLQNRAASLDMEALRAASAARGLNR